MTRRTWTWLWGILLVLVVYVLLVERPFTDDVRGPSKKALFLDTFSADDATTIEIRSGGTTSRLEKEGGAWVVASDGRFVADAKAVSDLLARIDTVQAGPVVSQNPENRSTFGVDTTAIEVRVFGGTRPLAHFRVGKSTPDFQGLFVQHVGSNDVYAVPGISRFLFDRGAQTWREKKLVPFSADEIVRVMTAWSDTMVTYLKQGTDSLKTSTWMVEGNFPEQTAAPALAGAVRPLIQAAATLAADGFPAVTDTVPTAWEPLAMRLQVEGPASQRVLVEIGQENAAGQHYARVAGRPAIYLVGPWRFNRFKRPWSQMLDPSAAMPAPPDAAKPVETSPGTAPH